MELRHLRYFVAVAEEASITGAAARLFVAQPSLSRQLRDLERHVGAPLLVRTSRGVGLTPEGELLLPLARRLLQDAAALTALFDGPPPAPHRRPLVVGLHDGALGPLTAPVLAALRSALPQVDLQVRQVLYSELDTCLQTGRVDVLMTVAGSTDTDTTCFHGLWADAMYAALPTTSPLARADALTVADVLPLPTVEAGAGPAHRVAPFLLSAHRGGERPRTVAAPAPSSRTDVLLQVAHQGAFVAVPATGTLQESPGVTFVPLSDAARLPVGLTVARRPRQPGVLVDFRATARTTTERLSALLPDARVLPAN